MKVIIFIAFFIFSLSSYSATFVGSELFKGEWSNENIVYSDLSVDFDNCAVMNSNTVLFGTCHKISDNLLIIISKMSVQAFTRDHNGKIVTMLLRDNSDMDENYFWSTAIVGIEK